MYCQVREFFFFFATLADEYVEDNNDHLSYLDCRLLLPSSVFAGISLSAIIIGLALGHYYDLRRRRSGTLPDWLFASGWYPSHCNNSLLSQIPEVPWHLPSALRLLELTVQANVLFRVATCVPNALRLFQSYVLSTVNAHFSEQWLWYRRCNAAAPVFLLLELSFCTVFSINTVRQDYQIVYRISFNLFVISAFMHMAAYTAVTIYRTNRNLEVLTTLSSNFPNCSYLPRFRINLYIQLHRQM
ncbi:unnamed protein product [Gongylonema pulchrum]|uniref:Post-GPI attachment to proteins factor 2 n=1 Tax=Gongylonema pulchrum TaxID=637853 RepID=A0A183CW22_9BILA|nr:unnamed protein product [Gongylonema pulchrum]